MRPKRHLLVVNLRELGEAEHLKPTAVGEDRTIPLHEVVQSPISATSSDPGRIAG